MKNVDNDLRQVKMRNENRAVIVYQCHYRNKRAFLREIAAARFLANRHSLNSYARTCARVHTRGKCPWPSIPSKNAAYVLIKWKVEIYSEFDILWRIASIIIHRDSCSSILGINFNRNKIKIAYRILPLWLHCVSQDVLGISGITGLRHRGAEFLWSRSKGDFVPREAE